MEITRSNEPLPYTREHVNFENDGITFAGELFIPRGDGPHPAMVHWHGSGDSVRWHYTYWADLFARQGIAMLVWDKRGCGGSGGDWRTVDFDTLARDGLAGVDLLRDRDDIDLDRIGAFGISQANWIMPIAAQLSKDIAYIVSVSGAQITVEEEGFFDFMVKLEDLGYDEETRAKALELMKLNNHVTRTGEGYDELRDYRKQYKREPWLRDMAMPLTPPGSADREFYKLIIDHDPVPILEAIDIPVIFLYGEADKSVEAPRSIAVLEKIKADYDKDFTIHMYAGADHGVRVPAAEDAPFPFRKHADGFIDTMVNWLHDRGFAASRPQ